MMKPATAVTGLIVALIAAGAGYWFGGHHAPAASAAAAPDAAPAPRKILYYRNPMGQPDTSPTPKKDSMGMDYIPVYADEMEAGAAVDDPGVVVKVNPERLQTLGVKTARAQMRAVDAPLRAVGRVEVNERATFEIAPRFEGWIETLQVNASGDPVSKGQPLFSVYSPDLVSAQKELSIASDLQKAGVADAAAGAAVDRLVSAAKERLKNWQISAGAPANDGGALTFTSPVNGVVLEKKAVAGMRFMAGTTLYRIADLSTVWVIADVYEKDLAHIKPGMAAVASFDALPGREFSARVDFLYPTLNTATRTTPVRLALSNPENLLRPGMFAHVDLRAAAQKPQLSVPLAALVEGGATPVVLRVLGAGRFQPQAVRVGRRGEADVEILAGLSEGDEVVTAANFLIDAESNLKAALASFSAAPPASPPPAAPAPAGHEHHAGH